MGETWVEATIICAAKMVSKESRAPKETKVS